MRRTLGARLWIVSIAAGLAVSAALGSQVDAGAAANRPVDHFVCYTVTSRGLAFVLPPSVRLTNALTSPSGAAVSFKTLDLHCAPVLQRASSANAGVTNPNAHQSCWAVTPKTLQPVKKLRVTTQFGTATIVTSALVRLCVPTWNKTSGSTKEPSAAPPGLSYYACYSVAYAPGTAPVHPPASLLLNDTVLGKTTSATAGAPKTLCMASVAAMTTGGHAVTFQVQNTTTALLCFAVTAHPASKSIYDQNQFGTAKLALTIAKLLCETSTSLSVVPPTTTTVPTTTTTMPPTTTTTMAPTTTTMAPTTTTTTVPDTTTTTTTTVPDTTTTATSP